MGSFDLGVELAEVEKHNADFSSLREMTEQHDGGMGSAWSDLSQALCEDDDGSLPMFHDTKFTFIPRIRTIFHTVCTDYR